MRLTWLQLSDFHFREEPALEHVRMLEAMVNGLVPLLAKADRLPDSVFVSGDIAFSGTEKEYAQATHFLNLLARALGCDPRSHWWVVPGNHDVARGLASGSEGSVTAFSRFTRDFSGEGRQWQADSWGRTETITHRGRRIAVIGLNSMRFGETEAEGRLRAFLEDAGEADTRIALFHHSLEERHASERVRHLLRNPGGAQLLMHGSRHSDRWARWGPDARSLELISGPCIPGRSFPPSVYVGQLFFERGFGRHTTYIYDQKRAEWRLSPSDSPDSSDGSWEFAFPESWRGETTRPRARAFTRQTRSQKRLPIGSSDFERIIEEDYFYVDKSHLIRRIWDADTVALIPRPRRFGKTINMEMLQAFFEAGEVSKRHLFDRLRIRKDREMMAHAGRYPVISLSFKDVKADTWNTVSRSSSAASAASSSATTISRPASATVTGSCSTRLPVSKPIVPISRFLSSFSPVSSADITASGSWF